MATVTIYKRGSRGEGVKRIQRALNLYADGIYGVLTEEAVREFQRKAGLKMDGIVGPATWTRLFPSLIGLRKSTRTITEIIVHCTATPVYRNVTVTDIRQWHKARGWSDIGYHYVVYLDGSVHEGRDVNLVGAHCTGHNQHSIGVCYVGGVDTDGRTAKDTRTDAQKASLLSLLNELKKLYPRARIYGHRDFANKSCPSFNATGEYCRL